MSKIKEAVHAANLKYPVLIVDIETEEQVYKEFILSAGGFAAARVPDENLEFISKELDLGENAREYFYKNPFAVLVAKQIAARMKFEDIVAVLHHEAGHIFHQHIPKNSIEMTSLNNGASFNLGHELQADRYASHQVGAKAVKRGIDAALRAVISYETKGIFQKVKRYWNTINDEKHQMRMKALY